jgi:hypothetical protein
VSKRKRKAATQVDETEELKRELEDLFPNLAEVGYEITSPKDSSHNCAAYAVGDTEHRWGGYSNRHLKSFGYYWPPNAQPGIGIAELVNAYKSIGFNICTDGEFEPGIEKVVLYIGDDGRWKHAAKQLPDGSWSSKIGVHSADIMHRTPQALSNSDYGRVACYMSRPIPEVSDEQKTQSEPGKRPINWRPS